MYTCVCVCANLIGFNIIGIKIYSFFSHLKSFICLLIKREIMNLLLKKLNQPFQNLFQLRLSYSTSKLNQAIKLLGNEYETDEWTNINESLRSKLERQLLHQKYHPLNHLANKIKHFFYQNYTSKSLNTPIFSIYDSFKPIVSTEQNFDR